MYTPRQERGKSSDGILGLQPGFHRRRSWILSLGLDGIGWLLSLLGCGLGGQELLFHEDMALPVSRREGWWSMVNRWSLTVKYRLRWEVVETSYL